MTVLVVGESLVDMVQSPDGRRHVHPGGSPFNVSIGIARLGFDVDLATQIGADEHGKLLDAALLQSRVRRLDAGSVAATSTAVATLNAAGSAAYSFNVGWDPTSLPDPAAYEAIHIGSLGCFLEPGASRVIELVHTADVIGVPVSYDPNVRMPVSADPTAWRSAFARAAAHADIVKLSDEDAAVLYPDISASDLARRLASEGAVAVVTQGPGGSVIAHRDRLIVIEAPIVDVVDTIGAGDSFMSALLAWFATRSWPEADDLQISDLHDLGAYASRAAAITVSRAGSDPPRSEELLT